MANPNIANLSTINGVTTYYNPSVTSAVVLVANPANSGHVYKINVINISNIDTSSNIPTSIALYTNGDVSQGSSPSGGVAYSLLSTVVVPYNASLVAIDKASSFYLQEGMSIIVTSSIASTLVYVVSYEDMF
jgi:hypothetical protein